MTSPPAPRRSSRWLRAALALGGLVVVLGGLVWQVLVRFEDYPVARLAARDAASLTVLDRKGRLLWQAGSASGERRSWTALVDMAPVAVQATLASEDHRFYEHSGVDVLAVLRA